MESGGSKGIKVDPQRGSAKLSGGGGSATSCGGSNPLTPRQIQPCIYGRRKLREEEVIATGIEVCNNGFSIPIDSLPVPCSHSNSGSLRYSFFTSVSIEFSNQIAVPSHENLCLSQFAILTSRDNTRHVQKYTTLTLSTP